MRVARQLRTLQRCTLTTRLVRPTLLPPLNLSLTPRRFQSTTPREPYIIAGNTYTTDTQSNTPPTILSKIPRKLLQTPSHPLHILRSIIESHFPTYHSSTPSHPVVSIFSNFDQLGFAPDHPGRSVTDSYYLNKEYMLRTHTSVHQIESYSTGRDAWLLSADVYRRDEIDSSHYPIFHQMEGTRVWPKDQLHLLAAENAKLAEQLAQCPLIIEDATTITESNPYQAVHDPSEAAEIVQNLKHNLNSLIFRLFGPVATKDGEPLRVRWIEAFFPFTSPSYEVEVWWNGQWLELLGCGVVQQSILDEAGVGHKAGWAFGLGLERLAMVLFSIPDIRLFWSQDPRFMAQFAQGEISTFKPYSKYPVCYRDMSFWIPQDKAEIWHENDYCEIVRDVAGDLVETVEKIDEYKHPKTGKNSKTFRLNYRSMDRPVTKEEVRVFQEEIERRTIEQMGIEMR